jgi:hypothetical protein
MVKIKNCFESGMPFGWHNHFTLFFNSNKIQNRYTFSSSTFSISNFLRYCTSRNRRFFWKVTKITVLHVVTWSFSCYKRFHRHKTLNLLVGIRFSFSVKKSSCLWRTRSADLENEVFLSIWTLSFRFHHFCIVKQIRRTTSTFLVV